MKNNRWPIIIGTILIVAVASLVIAKKKGMIGDSGVKQVAVEKAQVRSIIETVTASGKLQPHTEVKISSEVSGEIIKLNVKEGDSVRKGDLLIEINPVIYESLVNQAKAGLNHVPIKWHLKPPIIAARSYTIRLSSLSIVRSNCMIRRS